MNIAKIFSHSLGVTSHAKRFRTDLVFVWMARAIHSKNKIVIRSNGLGYLFEKNCRLFEWLVLSVRTAWPFDLPREDRRASARRVFMSQRKRNFYIPCMSRTQTRKKIPFNWLHSFFTWLSLYHKEVTKSLFQHAALCVTIFLQMKSATCNFTANSEVQKPSGDCVFRQSSQRTS